MSRFERLFFMGSKYSNEEKSNCIYYGYIDYVKRIRKEAYHSKDIENILLVNGYLQREPMTDCAIRLINSERKKYKKVKHKISNIVKQGNAVFITLTFTDDVLSKTSALTRRKYVARYLKEQSPYYVANIDFGVDTTYTQREHYHAVVCNRCDFSKWSYGFVFAEQVRTHDNDAKRVSRYVAKLTNHALKVKTVSSRLIYSRDVI